MLSVVLALALTAALAACGSDEPSGVTGPDRTASTPTETPASPTQTPTTTESGDTPTATAALRPTATRPPLPTIGPTSVETDREALAALYNATDGENWNISTNWLSDAPLGEWEGVSTDEGRVRLLGLNDNGLSGEIPAELGNLSHLVSLSLWDNDLSGEIPAELRQPLRPDTSVARPQRLERGDTRGAGQPLQLGSAVPQRQRVERGDTGGVGQPLPPEISGP